jgi:hypothetical protein
MAKNNDDVNDDKHIGKMYVDAKGVLRIVMQEYPKHIVRGIDVSNMNITGIIVTTDLESIFEGHGSFKNKKHKVLWID